VPDPSTREELLRYFFRSHIRMEALEWVVIILIAMEIVLGLLH
jgi:uncharacterized Rmd1/YagE family protein